MTRNPKHYIKMLRIGSSISYKKAERQYGGEFPIDVTDGWWIVDDFISQKEIDHAKPTELTNIIIIVHGNVYEESASGLISLDKQTAYITNKIMERLF